MKLVQTRVFLLSLFLPLLFTGPAVCAALPARSLSNDKPLVPIFTCRNATKNTLTIERIAVSCDCVQARIGSPDMLPVTVLPRQTVLGQTVLGQISVTKCRRVPGTVSRSACFYLRGGSLSGLR